MGILIIFYVSSVTVILLNFINASIVVSNIFVVCSKFINNFFQILIFFLKYLLFSHLFFHFTYQTFCPFSVVFSKLTSILILYPSLGQVLPPSSFLWSFPIKILYKFPISSHTYYTSYPLHFHLCKSFSNIMWILEIISLSLCNYLCRLFLTSILLRKNEFRNVFSSVT